MIGLPNCAYASFRKSANWPLVNLSYCLKKLRPSQVISPKMTVLAWDPRAGVDGALPLEGVDPLARTGVGDGDAFVLDASDVAVRPLLGDEPPHPPPESGDLLRAGPSDVPAHGHLHSVAAAAQHGAHVRDSVLNPGHRLDQVARLLGRPAGGLLQSPPYLLHVPLGNQRGPAGPRPCLQSGQALLLVSAVPLDAPGSRHAKVFRSPGPGHPVALHMYDQHCPSGDVCILFCLVCFDELIYGVFFIVHGRYGTG